MTYRIRSAHVGDVPGIHRLILALAEFEQLSHLVVASEADLARALFGANSRVEALVAEPSLGVGSGGGDGMGGGDGEGRDGSAPLLAFALFFHNYSTFLGRQGLYLEDLFVDPHWRRRGIARAMLERLASLALERGCGRFEWTVLDWNQDAIKFYQGLGASVLPDWRVVRVTGVALAQLAAGRTGV